MSERDALLAEIEAYAEQSGLRPSTICLRAVGNGHLYGRIRVGGDCSTGVAARIRKYMRDNPPEPRRKRAPARAPEAAA